MDFSFANLFFDSLQAKISWKKKRADNQYEYGLNFEFNDVRHHGELKEYLYE